MNNCGISRWDDPKEINAQLKALTDQPIWEVTDEYYNNVILKYYDEKCTQSRAVYEESQKYIPGGVQHNLAFNKPFPHVHGQGRGRLPLRQGRQQVHRFPPGRRPHHPGQQLPRDPGKGLSAAQ